MALDGLFLNTIKSQIEKTALSSRVDKIYQPSKDEIIIALRSGGQTLKLLLSANAGNARIHFTKTPIENPKSPPMFCMLLRKHLSAGRLIAVRQNGLDRVLNLDFEVMNEIGDVVVITLVTEIMGRHSNIILVNQNGKIIDSIKRVNDQMSSVRTVLPGKTFCHAPTQDKINILTATDEQILCSFLNAPSNDIQKSIIQSLEGVSPILAREIAHRFTGGKDIAKNLLSDYYKKKYLDFILELKDILIKNSYCLTTVFDCGKPRDFTVISTEQYDSTIIRKKYDDPSLLLDEFYSERDRVERTKQRSFDLIKLIFNANERITKKLALQEQELLQCANRDSLKTYADLINSNLYAIKKGQSSVILQNFYDDNFAEIKIDLNPLLTPSQNAQKYYTEYRKSATAEKKLVELMTSSRDELLYLDSVYDSVLRTNGESELLEIREELYEQGYIKRSKAAKNKPLRSQPMMKFVSSDGFTIVAGRNNKQNDKLTLKVANNYDMWLHTHDIPGSHVVIVSDNKPISKTALEQAAIIAAFNSKARDSSQVAVDYTLIRYVKKPVGAKPGMVIFTNNKTAYVTPDENIVNSLKI
ncbi:MAG: NFACT RNA binding domain-containing protein [Oscillospiraceae bacterium]